MSFASKTKTQLARQISDSRNSLLSELSAIVRVCGTLKLKSGGKIDVLISSENAAVARLVFTLFKKVFKRQTDVIVKKNSSLKKHHIYEIYVDDALDMLTELGIINQEDGLEIVDVVPEQIITSESSRRAYIRGVFLGSGSLSDPEKSYHLEFVTHSETYALSLIDLINSYGLFSKAVVRKNNYVVYIKEGDQIVDVLNIIGAHQTLLAFENTRIVKQMRNNVNRVVNCETANLNKTVNASIRQVEAIAKIRDVMGLDALPDNLREIALLRLEQPELSLTELGQMLSPPIGKSGINHRLKKIEKLALKIMEDD
jgi:DNA-binding protein WhiA